MNILFFLVVEARSFVSIAGLEKSVEKWEKDHFEILMVGGFIIHYGDAVRSVGFILIFIYKNHI